MRDLLVTLCNTIDGQDGPREGYEMTSDAVQHLNHQQLV